jgi:hypothetical protein
MKYRRTLAALLVGLLALSGVALAGGEDFLVTLSWLKENLTEKVAEELEDGAAQMEEEVLASIGSNKTNKNQNTTLTAAEIDGLVSKVAAQLQPSGGSSTSQLTLAKGAQVTGPLGGGMILESGSATVSSFTGNDLIDVTAGAAAAPGSAAKVGSYYLVGTDNGCGLTITSDTAIVRVMDGAYSKGGYSAKYEEDAELLSELGIFRGSNLGFELERVPTRQEALIMLIRLLGEEEEALAYTGKSPFTDLTGWLEGRNYIHYGLAMGYTNGIDAVTFNQYGAASRHVYLTYVLRALGYDDKAGDFVWNTTSDDLAVEIGLLTSRQLTAMKESGFYRDHVVLISKNALTAELKDGSMTLGEQLAMNGVFSWDDLEQLW